MSNFILKHQAVPILIYRHSVSIQTPCSSQIIISVIYYSNLLGSEHVCYLKQPSGLCFMAQTSTQWLRPVCLIPKCKISTCAIKYYVGQYKRSPKTADCVFVLLPNQTLNIQYTVYYETQTLDKHVSSVKTIIVQVSKHIKVAHSVQGLMISETRLA